MPCACGSSLAGYINANGDSDVFYHTNGELFLAIIKAWISHDLAPAVSYLPDDAV
jgi:hypothetical protein